MNHYQNEVDSLRAKMLATTDQKKRRELRAKLEHAMQQAARYATHTEKRNDSSI